MSDSTPTSSDRGRTPLADLARLFLKLGVIGFGGPGAHIAMMEDEVVTRRGWLSRQRFLDLVGATSLIPGPNSTEMTMHIGLERRGWPGLLLAGTCFILPAALLTGVLAGLYAEFGTTPAIEPLLYGIKPAVIAVILGALWRLGRTAYERAALAPVGLGVAASLFFGLNEVLALLAGGVLGMVWLIGLEASRGSGGVSSFLVPLFGLTGGAGGAAWVHQGSPVDVSLERLFLFFLKVGAVLYGSGYVLVAFLEGDLVQGFAWLTERQLLDAIAIGQFTPGPVLTTATFVGYLVAGVPGAVVATIGIFLPSFLFVGALNPIVTKLRESRWTSAFLDAVNASAVALMLVVTVRLGATVFDGWVPIAVFVLAAIASLRFRLAAAWVVVGGAVLGWIAGWL